MSEQYSSGTVPQFADPKRKLMVKELWALASGGGGTLGGTGAPTSTPTASYALYIQTDSTPNPGLLWEWYGGAWHAT